MSTDTNEGDCSNEETTSCSTCDSEEGPRRLRAKGYYGEELKKEYAIPYDQYQKETAVIQRNGFVQLAMLTGTEGNEHE